MPRSERGPKPPGGGDAGAAGEGEESLGDWIDAVIPPEAQVHFLNAGREFLAGVEVTVDHHVGGRKRRADERRSVRIEIE